MKRLFASVNAIIAMSIGIIVMLGYFTAPLIPTRDDIPFTSYVRFYLFQWAIILAGVAVLIGIWNMFSVHLLRIKLRKTGFIYSLILIFFLLLTAIVSILPDLHPLQNILLNGILVPTEISLLALISVTIIYSSMRILRQQSSLTSIVFLITLLLILLGTGSLPFVGQNSFFSGVLRPFITNNLVNGGARGILIGVGLGILTTGLRILFGADRPYGGK